MVAGEAGEERVQKKPTLLRPITNNLDSAHHYQHQINLNTHGITLPILPPPPLFFFFQISFSLLVQPEKLRTLRLITAPRNLKPRLSGKNSRTEGQLLQMWRPVHAPGGPYLP
jgi:hypothetical protein